MYKALLEAMLTYDDNTKKIQLANEGFTGESGDFTQSNPDAPPYNHGLKTRHKWFKDSATVEFVGASSCHDSLIFMSTHKAMAARCLSRHQATYGLPPSAWPL